MTRRQFFRHAGVASAVLAGAVAMPRSAHAAAKPNILFLFSDDQTYEAIHALGNDEIHTPNLDRLVKRGTTFTHAYNQGGWNGAVCIASRTMLTTGRFLWHAEARHRELEEERSAGRLWPQLLKVAGYDTYMTGKWHVRIDAASVFDHIGHVREGMPTDHYGTTKVGYNRPLEGQQDAWQPWDTAQGGYWEGGKHWSEVVGDDGEAFLAQAVQRDNPFFMYLAFNAPHDPRQSPKGFVDQYPLEKIAVPESFEPEYPLAKDIGAGPGLRDEDLAPFPRTEHAVKVHRQEYYAIVTHMDQQIGRILDALDKSGKADNTYIVFTSDHGLAVGQHGLMGKQNMYDHSVRVPLTICGPGIASDKRIDTPCYLQDIMPTTLDWAGVTQPEHVEFKSLAPLLAGTSTPHYNGIYSAYMDKQRMITDGGYKLIHYPVGEVWLLFDLKKDPEETANLAEDPANLERLAALRKKLWTWQKATGDALVLKQY
jgi:arylsulfatase A-like enzyme